MSKFEYDYFISFSGQDNQPVSKSAKGWVTNFHKFLEVLLTQLLGHRPKVLFYSNGEKPSEEQLAKCARMIVVLSPDFVESSSCIEDIEVFLRHVEANKIEGLSLRDRVFKVVKLPVLMEQEPSKVRDLLGFNLFLTNHSTGQISEIQEFFSEEAEKAYWMKLAELAFEVYQSIQLAELAQKPAGKSAALLKNYVYLAESGYDMAVQRAIIKRDLLRHGFRVLPEITLPTNMKEMEAMIKSDLAKCALSIHLIGDSYGFIPKGAKKSILHLQNDLAAEHASMTSVADDGKMFRRLIWISPALRLTDEKQRLFVENVRRDMDALVGAEILQTPLEDFKAVIRNGLLDLEKKSTAMTEEKGTKKRKGGPVIYLIFDKADESEVAFLRKFLEEQGLEVIPSEFNKPFMELRTTHINNLKICDGALIFKKKVNDKWVQMKALDLLKAPGLGRNKEISFRGIYQAYGSGIAIAEIKNLNVRIVEEPAGQAPDILIPYIQQLRTNR